MDSALAYVAVILIGMNSSASLEGVNNMYPAGILINNPGCLKKSNSVWKGQARLQDHKRFVRFLTPVAGLRAMMKTLKNYEDLYQISNISLIINRYAPPSENNTDSYIRDVSDRMQIPPNYYLDLEDPDVLISLAKAIVMHENGHSPHGMPPEWYDEAVYHEAAIMALESSDDDYITSN